MKFLSSSSFAILPVLASLAACATPAAPENADLTTLADRHKIAVIQSAERLDVPVAQGDETLSGAAARTVDQFAKSYIQIGHGAIILSTPSGGANADEASRLAQAIRLRLAQGGVPFAAIAGSSYDAANAPNSPIRLSFTRFEAQGPECTPLWRQDLTANTDNAPWESHGCANQANLAAMIADPADLLGPRAETPRDAARRANTLEAYRKGAQTHATRSSDERVAVSSAVQ